MNEFETRARWPAHRGGAGGSSGRSGSELQFRAGGRVLSLYSTTLHGTVLRSLAEGPVALEALRGRAGDPPPQVLRGAIGNLIGLGALESRKANGAPDLLDNGLTALGRDLLSLAAVLEHWLEGAPSGRLDIEADAAREAIKALVAGWSSTMLRALAVRPLSLAELDALMKAFSASALERRLLSMRSAGQVRSQSSDNGGQPAYAVTEWLRGAVAPLLRAIHCERTHLADQTAPPDRIDVETLLLLSVPLLLLPEGATGRCQLAVELDGAGPGLAGVTVVVDHGRVVSCVSTLDRERKPANRVHGDTLAWLEAVCHGDLGRLDLGGLDGLGRTIVEALRARLFG